MIAATFCKPGMESPLVPVLALFCVPSFQVLHQRYVASGRRAYSLVIDPLHSDEEIAATARENMAIGQT
jgi:hypothetical protein